MLRRRETNKVKLFQTSGLQPKMPQLVGSTVMFGMMLAKDLVGRGFTPIMLLAKLMLPIKFFLTVY
jgi:hypothetical protein